MSCDRLAVLNQGLLRFVGTPRELIQKFQGQVYEIEISEEEAKEKVAALGKKVLTSQRRDDFRAVRVLGEVEGGRPVTPSLEDAYLALIRS